jgi:hypothetical protein
VGGHRGQAYSSRAQREAWFRDQDETYAAFHGNANYWQLKWKMQHSGLWKPKQSGGSLHLTLKRYVTLIRGYW